MEDKTVSYILDGKRIVMGTCYYPEHWPERLWREDLRRMKETGIEVIRIAEFAWNKTEPREGEFTFDFFDRFLDLCEEEGMKVIFSTPHRNAAGLADRKVSGDPQRHGGGGPLPSRHEKAL